MPTDAALNQYLDFLRFGSISTDSKYKDQVLGCAEWLLKKLTAIGLDAAQHETAGHPIIVARGPKKAGRPTVLIYGHYDVQPVDPLDLWNRPPFNPGIENGIVTARGASDNKGQIFAHILGLEQALKEKGDLPVNLILLIEGEEEIGSPHLAPFLDTHRDALACDVVAISDSSMIAPGHPTFTYGLRGLSAVEVTVTGPDHDLHSGIFGGAVENPATVLARLIAGFHDKNLKVRIKGFYDGVKALAPWERKAWKPRCIRRRGIPSLSRAVPGRKGVRPSSFTATTTCSRSIPWTYGDGPRLIPASKRASSRRAEPATTRGRFLPISSASSRRSRKSATCRSTSSCSSKARRKSAARISRRSWRGIATGWSAMSWPFPIRR